MYRWVFVYLLTAKPVKMKDKIEVKITDTEPIVKLTEGLKRLADNSNIAMDVDANERVIKVADLGLLIDEVNMSFDEMRSRLNQVIELRNQLKCQTNIKN